MNQDFPDFDLYQALEVDPQASRLTLEAAYRSLCRQHHPDTAADPGALGRMQRINAAHDILKDPALRAAYDAIRREAPERPKPGRARDPKASRTGSKSSSHPGLSCSRCGRSFKTTGGLAWHDENNKNCAR